MRPGVEAGRFEVPPGFFEQCSSPRRQLGGMLPQQAIDVVDPESDAFHVKGADRARQRFALRQDGFGLRPAC